MERPSIANQCGTKSLENKGLKKGKTRTDSMGRVRTNWEITGWHGTEGGRLVAGDQGAGRLPRHPAGCLGGRPAGQLAPATGSRPSVLAEVGWFLDDFGRFFGVVWGPIFNPKDAGTQVRYNTKQTKQI